MPDARRHLLYERERRDTTAAVEQAVGPQTTVLTGCDLGVEGHLAVPPGTGRSVRQL